MVGAFVCLTVMTQTAAPFYVALIVTIAFAALLGLVLRKGCAATSHRGAHHSRHHGDHRACQYPRGLSHMIWSPDTGLFLQYSRLNLLDLGFAIVPSGLLWGFVFAVVCTEYSR